MKCDAISWESAVEWLRSQPDKADLVRACFYDDPLPAAAARYAAGDEWTTVREIVGSGPGLALDLAAGRGIAAFALARDGWRVIAVEPDPSNIVGAGAIRSLVAATGVDVNIVEEWGERLPFEAATFDLVHCRQGLHHARDLFAMCREAARVLKPGGMFIATREHVISRREDLPAFLASHALHHLYGGENAFLLEEYLEAIVRAGMKLRFVLNPFESEINFFPSNRRELKHNVARQYHWPWPALIPDAVLHWLGRRTDAPGRLYTFAAVKPREA